MEVAIRTNENRARSCSSTSSLSSSNERESHTSTTRKARAGFSLGGLVLVGGVLSSASTYRPLAEGLAGEFTVHVMNRRGRPPSGPHRPRHDIDDECADLAAVASAAGARRAFGHSFGGLVVLETARRKAIFDELYLYEPGVSIAGSLAAPWLDGYQRLLQGGDRRGAFAWMVKNAGFAPRAFAVMPLWSVKAVLRLAIRGPRWRSMEGELAQAIPRADTQLLPGLGHLAPEDQPLPIAEAILTSRP